MEKQIKELTLLLLYLTSWTEKEPYGEFQRAWKGYDFDILNELDEGNQFAFGHPACHIVPAYLAEIEEKESAEILDAKLYLKEIGRYEKVIKNKLEELKHLRELAVSFNHNSNSDVVQNSCDADKIGSTVGQIIDKENDNCK